MSNENNDKKITLTEEQATRAAETLLNAWLRGNDSSSTSSRNSNTNRD